MKKLLDLGCGPGTINNIGTYEKMKKLYKIYGIDFIEDNIKRIKVRFPSGEFKIGNAEKIPYPNATFDYVLAMHVFEHVLDLSQVLKEIKRVSKKDAYLSIAVPHKRLEILLNRLLPHYIEEGHHHQRVFDEESLVSTLQNAGYTIKKVSNGKWPMFIVIVVLALVTRLTRKIAMEEQSGVFMVSKKDYLLTQSLYPIYSFIYSFFSLLNVCFPFMNSLIPFEIEVIAQKKN